MVGLQDEDLGKVEHKNICHQTDSIACLHSQINDILMPLLNFIIFADKNTISQCIIYRVSHNMGPTMFFIIFSGSGARTEVLLTFIKQPQEF